MNVRWRVIVAMMVFLCTACGTAGTRPTVVPTVQPTATSQTSSASDFPTGVYTTKITDADLNDPDLAANVGNWTVGFKQNEGQTAFTAAIEGVAVARGSYQVNQQEVTISDKSVVCAGQGDGTYTWMIEGTNLVLSPVKDACVPRKLVLTTHPLQKEP